jgi:hypothetical protein
MADEDQDKVGGVPVEKKTPKDEDKSDRGIGKDAEDRIKILRSKNLEWFFDKDTGRWYASYQMPNSNRRIFFEATPNQMDQIFGEGYRPAEYAVRTFERLSKNQTFSGDIGEMEGEGTFEHEVKRTIELALDEGTLPEWASKDGAVMDLVYIAHTEEKSDDWLIGEISKLASFRERFPHLKQLVNKQGLNLIDAIGSFLAIEKGLSQLMSAYYGGTHNIDPETVGDMLLGGQSLEDAQMVFDNFTRFKENKDALDAFNEVLVARGQEPLDEDGQLEFLAGNAASELYAIWEEATVHHLAEEAGLNLTVEEAMSLAARSEGYQSYESIAEGVQAAAQNVLKFRADIDMGRYGLDQEDLIDAAMGVAPRSGMSQAELARNAERALAAGQAAIEGQRVNRFRQFTDDGTPTGVSTTTARAT